MNRSLSNTVPATLIASINCMNEDNFLPAPPGREKCLCRAQLSGSTVTKMFILLPFLLVLVIRFQCGKPMENDTMDKDQYPLRVTTESEGVGRHTVFFK